MTESYVTVATDDITCLGCLVLCNSLKQTGTEKKLSVLIYPDVSQHLRTVLQKSFDYAINVTELIHTICSDNLPNEFGKLKCWLLTQFTKCVFLESDVLVVENIDDLFERQEFSAVADSRWPDSFDAGVFVYVPSDKTYSSLIEFSVNNKAKDSVQVLLNLFFSNWSSLSIENKIPFLYNCQLNSAFYTHTNALVHFGRSIKAAKLGNSVHDMMQPSMMQDSNYDNWNRLWLIWWKIFSEMVKPSLAANQSQDFNRNFWSSDKLRSGETSPSKTSDYTTIQSQASTTTVEEFKEVHQIVNATVCGNESSSGSYHNMPNDVQNYSSVSEFCSNDNRRDTQHQIVNATVCGNESSSGSYHNMPNDVQNYSSVSEFCSNDNRRDTQSMPENFENAAQKSEHSEIQFDNASDVAIVTEKPSDGELNENLENSHRQKWERGEIDYMGKDSFENILTQLKTKINSRNTESNVNVEE